MQLLQIVAWLKTFERRLKFHDDTISGTSKARLDVFFRVGVGVLSRSFSGVSRTIFATYSHCKIQWETPGPRLDLLN